MNSIFKNVTGDYGNKAGGKSMVVHGCPMCGGMPEELPMGTVVTILQIGNDSLLRCSNVTSIMLATTCWIEVKGKPALLAYTFSLRPIQPLDTKKETEISNDLYNITPTKETTP